MSRNVSLFFPPSTVAWSGTNSDIFSLQGSCYFLEKSTRVLVFFFFLLGIPGTKHCTEAAPILAVPGRRMVEGGRDQESFQALLTLEMRIAHVCLLNQKGEKAGCQFATLLQWSHAHCCCRPVCPVQMPVHYKPKKRKEKKKKNYLDSSASRMGINIKKYQQWEKSKKRNAHIIWGFTCYASIFCLYFSFFFFFFPI